MKRIRFGEPHLSHRHVYFILFQDLMESGGDFLTTEYIDKLIEHSENDRSDLKLEMY